MKNQINVSKTPKIVRVTTSAGVSPISSVMVKKSVNKAEEFIEKVAHPAEVVMEKNLDFTTENIPVQELVYQTKDIFPKFGEDTVVALGNTYDFPQIMIWPEGTFTNTLNHNGGTTYSDGIFTYNLENGNYVRTHDAFLANSLQYLDSVWPWENDTILFEFTEKAYSTIVLALDIESVSGRLYSNVYRKPHQGTLLESFWSNDPDIELNDTWKVYSVNSEYTLEGNNELGFYFGAVGTNEIMQKIYSGIKDGTIIPANPSWTTPAGS